jgi:hypothetical protein
MLIGGFKFFLRSLESGMLSPVGLSESCSGSWCLNEAMFATDGRKTESVSISTKIHESDSQAFSHCYLATIQFKEFQVQFIGESEASALNLFNSKNYKFNSLEKVKHLL